MTPDADDALVACRYCDAGTGEPCAATCHLRGAVTMDMDLADYVALYAPPHPDTNAPEETAP